MKCATIADTKAHFSELIADIESGEEVIITRRGKPVARLTEAPHPVPTTWTDLADWIKERSLPVAPSVVEMREQVLL